MKRFLVFGRSVTSYSKDKRWDFCDSFDEFKFAEIYITLQQEKNKRFGESTQYFYHVAVIDLPEITDAETV